MKTTLRKVFGILAISAAFFTSCTSDDNGKATEPTSGFVVNPNDFKGTITEGVVTLDASKVYKLTGKIQINSGAILTIPAGTKIEGLGGTSAYIAVAQGGKINVNGTAAKPVIMTSGLATKAPGDWGGLVICGKAPINRVSGGMTTAQSEVADLTYGGTINNDSSGSITYLIVEYAGAAFNSEKEFNGVSLFGVGSGTVFQNVQAIHGSDDGFEFFGGTVNTSNLISIGNEDDQFDWTEGWNGTNTNWYGRLDFGKGNRGIEADNFEFGFANTPIANPSITNISLIGPGSTADAANFAENAAIKLRRGTKAIFTNVYLSQWKVGADIEHDETLAFVGSALKISNVTFNEISTSFKGKNTAGASTDVSAGITEGASTGAGAGAGKPSWASEWAIGF
ncbi:hypothetical protein FLAN108750_06455 [Flavobacterium antarcticum]|uniref:hypothetical protein n=1 Tax=Flavobacterium antarcticum TaxID=271155 RepID=UPI0003B38F4A|nr:hypothetical protein [Flavobacterium antarcticum]